MNTITSNRKQAVLQFGVDRHPVSIDRMSYHDDHLIKGLIEVKEFISRRQFLNVISNAGNDLLGSVGIPYNAGKRLHCLAQVWRPHFQEAHASTRVIACCGNRMKNLVSQRGSQLSHHAQPVEVREIRFQLPQLPTFGFRPFAFRHVDCGPNDLDKFSRRGV